MSKEPYLDEEYFFVCPVCSNVGPLEDAEDPNDDGEFICWGCSLEIEEDGDE